MKLYCPFCHALEEERVEAVDNEGKRVLLVMFDCPFHFRFSVEQDLAEEKMQIFLNDWRLEKGDEWLESIGPVMKARETRNISRYESTRQT